MGKAQMESLEGRRLLSASTAGIIAPAALADGPAAVMIPAVRRHPDWAPNAISGYTLRATIRRGAGVFARRGTFTITFARRGNAYRITGGPGVADSQGTYRYSHTGYGVATIALNDSLVGPITAGIVFTSAKSGTYGLTASGGYQTGTFTL